MRTPVVLPSYMRTVLEAQRAGAGESTWTTSVVAKARKKTDVRVRPNTWVAKLLRAVGRAALETRRVLANGRS